MQREVILLKCGEMVLKGLNRSTFEEALLRSLRQKLRRFGEFSLRSAQSTFYVEPKEDCDISAVTAALSEVFGILAVTRAAVCEKNLEAIGETTARYLEKELLAAKTFKVESRRSDKSFPLKSPELSGEVGYFLLQKYPHLKADMERPDLTVKVEVRDYGAYISGGDQEGAGGMPYRTAGKGMLLLSGGIDSPVAGYMMAKRGLHLSAVHFHSFPYTSEQAKEKVVSLARILCKYTHEMHFNLVPLTKIQTGLKKHCPEALLTLCMRWCMTNIASKVAENVGCEALITGESLGQVASQTLKAMAVTEKGSALPIFRPLIGLDKSEIVKIANKIGTFETSILPYEDCCTLFTPRHPKTRPELEEVLAALALVPDLADLIEEAVRETECFKVYES